MKPPTLVALVVLSSVGAFSCDEGKYDKYLSQPEASAAAPASTLPPPPPAPAPSASTTWKKKSATDCKPHPATIDFEDNAALEAEVRRKLGKDKAPITPSDLAQVRSLNLSSTQTHQIEPCIFPMFTSLKDLYFGPSDFDDLLPIQKLPLETLVVGSSPVKDLHPIEGLKRLDRLDLSHTLIDDNSLKIVGRAREPDGAHARRRHHHGSYAAVEPIEAPEAEHQEDDREEPGAARRAAHPQGSQHRRDTGHGHLAGAAAHVRGA